MFLHLFFPFACRNPFFQPVNPHKEERNEDYADKNGDYHSEKDSRTDILTACRARTGSEYQRKHAENECQRRHHDRPEPQPERIQCGGFERDSLRHFVLCKFHNEDGILGDKSDKHHEAYLEIDIALITENPDTEICPRDSYREGQYDCNRYRPAFILCGKEKEYEEQGEAEHKARLSSLFLFLIGQSAPLDADIVRKMFACSLFENVHGLSGTVAVGRFACNRHGVVHVETRN